MFADYVLLLSHLANIMQKMHLSFSEWANEAGMQWNAKKYSIVFQDLAENRYLHIRDETL